MERFEHAGRGPRADVLREARDKLEAPTRAQAGDVLLLRRQIGGHHRLRLRVRRHLALPQPDRARAEAGQRVQVVADEQHGAPALRHLVHLAEAAALEGRVAHREHLVDHQDLRREVSGDGKGQPHAHARRVVLDGGVEELLHLREVEDLVEARLHLAAAHPEQRAVQEDVPRPDNSGWKPCPLEQAADVAFEPTRPCVGE